MTNSLDLHGLHREDAFMVVEDELLRLSMLGSFQIDIITGNSKPMQDGVINICEQHGFQYIIPSHNLGRVTVSYFSM